jgi:transposase-like protein
MTDSEKYWFEHLRLIDRTGSTTKAYADLHGLSAKELYEWRRKFKTRDRGQADQSDAVNQSAGQPTAGNPTTSNPFVPVQVRPPVAQPTSCVVQCGAVRVELDTLPSVQWLASLNVALRRAS